MLPDEVSADYKGDLKGNQTRKNRLTLRGAVVWNCESGDRIKGRDGTCILAVGSLAGADSWSITNVAAFLILHCRRGCLLFTILNSRSKFPIFNSNCG
jgi:hypothetical protein